MNFTAVCTTNTVGLSCC
uniref:Uncharacterized protein n=1 Tax=Anguilla anguilla TaxID=7936 RepID=A0A0E9UKX3_ANGAN